MTTTKEIKRQIKNNKSINRKEIKKEIQEHIRTFARRNETTSACYNRTMQNVSSSQLSTYKLFAICYGLSSIDIFLAFNGNRSDLYEYMMANVDWSGILQKLSLI